MKIAINQLDDNNLLFVFKFVCIDVHVDPELYDDEQTEFIKQQVQMLAKEIYIDKSYVDYEETKYEKTFMYEDGWNNLCNLVKKTKYGKKSTKDEDEQLKESYKAMIVQYILQVLDDFDYDISHISLQIAENTSFMVEIHKNAISDNYPGKWQTW